MAIHFIAFIIMFAVKKDFKLWLLYMAQVGLLFLIYTIYRHIYQDAARLLVNHMCMLMIVGLIMLTRLNYNSALRQFEIAAVSFLISIFVPNIIAKFKILKEFTWAYAVIGILALGGVLVLGRISGGAKISFSIAGITLQPSEFVKIIFVFYIACMLYKSTEFKHLVLTTAIAALHVMILVASTDLGAALIFFVTYVIMLFAATKAPLYLICGFGLGAVAAKLASKVFSHVRVRVLAWKNPLGNYYKGGYQVSQGLFAIITGGWFGTGIYQGMPNKIPVAVSDFIFAAISEELGGIFGICLILVCLSCFLIMITISTQIRSQFYKLIALGFACVYGMQVFLNIGGVIKAIPSTGVTLPLVSYGGSSIFCVIIMFAIVQGLFIIRKNEVEIHEEVIKPSKIKKRPSKKSSSK